jgi:hypothetical protein
MLKNTKGETLPCANLKICLDKLGHHMVWLLDPDVDAAPIAVPVDEFMLAWSGMDYLYAVVSVFAEKGGTKV